MSDTYFSPRGDKAELEEGSGFSPKFDADGLITVVTTDAETGDILMVAYMNEEALTKTIETGEAWYWSRSRGELWHKGDTSGQLQTVVEQIEHDQFFGPRLLGRADHAEPQRAGAQRQHDDGHRHAGADAQRHADAQLRLAAAEHQPGGARAGCEPGDCTVTTARRAGG